MDTFAGVLEKTALLGFVVFAEQLIALAREKTAGIAAPTVTVQIPPQTVVQPQQQQSFQWGDKPVGSSYPSAPTAQAKSIADKYF